MTPIEEPQAALVLSIGWRLISCYLDVLSDSHGLEWNHGNCHIEPAMDMPFRTSLGAETPPSPIATEVERRRTFAIISHPDAGKTTLTEKLLLFGGAIQLAGQVKAKRYRRSTHSDWMAIERERGISVVTSVMTFEYGGRVFNLLDTPGHEDFSEDTYRTLTAVNSAVMVIDGGKGIEPRTRKLFEVCRLRDIPIITFINKMDRESRDPFDLIDEIEKTLAVELCTDRVAARARSRFRRHHRRKIRRRAPARRQLRFCRQPARDVARRNRRFELQSRCRDTWRGA